MVTDRVISETILNLARQRGPGKTLCPSEVARVLAGSDEANWRALMSPIHAEAVRLALEGDICLKKGGTIIDPHRISGAYRIGITGPV